MVWPVLYCVERCARFGFDSSVEIAIVLYLKEDLCLSLRLSDEDQGLNYRAGWAQTAYICKAGPGYGFRLGPIPIGR